MILPPLLQSDPRPDAKFSGDKKAWPVDILWDIFNLLLIGRLIKTLPLLPHASILAEVTRTQLNVLTSTLIGPILTSGKMFPFVLPRR